MFARAPRRASRMALRSRRLGAAITAKMATSIATWGYSFSRPVPSASANQEQRLPFEPIETPPSLHARTLQAYA